MPLSASLTRAAPDWLVDEWSEERLLGVLKSGKEAEVFLVERRSTRRSCLLAHKRYRPRRPAKGELRELGFSKGTLYRHDMVYRAGWHLNSRDRRAVQTRTSYGHELTDRLWPVNEFEMLRRAWDAGVAVPYAVDRSPDGVVMEYVGDESEAAPLLAHARLDPRQLADAWEQVLDALRRLASGGIVHADLSAYNALWWRGKVVLIDFPQAVDAASNAAAPDLLYRDVGNVGSWFGRRGLPVDAEVLFAELAALL